MAFDPATGQMILFGGLGTSGLLNDTWNWNGTTWTELFPATSPSVRDGTTMAFDQATGQLILFGGANGGFHGDTWNWDGTTWTELFPAASPSARFFAMMDFDQANGQLILFGGEGLSGKLGDTWNWGPISLAPVAMATPSSQTICSGNTTSIALSADVSGTTFSWTVMESGVTGASDGSGSTIAQTLTTTTLGSGTATYTVTPTSPAGCTGNPITVVVTVNPIPTATATPSSQTICTGSTTSIALSSNVPGTTFSWTVMESGVTGASDGSGSSIAQTLTTTTPGSGTATYTVTPTAPGGCIGSQIIVTVTVNQCSVEGPTHFRGKVINCPECSLAHVLTWRESTDPNVIGYKLFQNHKLINVIYGSFNNKIILRDRKKDKVYHYEIVAFTASLAESQPLKLRCLKCRCRHAS
jgi:hypothetical protein